MKVNKKKKKRKFLVNPKTNLYVNDVGSISLEKNDHLTINFLKKQSGICVMDWGMYATPSINKRLKDQGCLTALTKNISNKLFIMIVNKKKKKSFFKYCKKEKIKVIKWIK